MSKIEWCDKTWNPITGCLRGCEYCYAKGIAQRFGGRWVKDTEPLDSFGGNNIHGGDGGIHDLSEPLKVKVKDRTTGKGTHLVDAPYPYCFDPTFHRYRLNLLARKTKPKTIFVGSMSDVFGDWVPDEWIEAIFKACFDAPQHRYLFLTKNPARYYKMQEFLANQHGWQYGPEFWFGMTITGKTTIFTSSSVLNCFLSIEPLLHEIKWMALTDIKWVIVGAETGHRKNKITPKREWVETIVNICCKANIPVFLKNNLIELMGKEYVESNQQFPWAS